MQDGSGSIGNGGVDNLEFSRLKKTSEFRPGGFRKSWIRFDGDDRESGLKVEERVGAIVHADVENQVLCWCVHSGVGFGGF